MLSLAKGAIKISQKILSVIEGKHINYNHSLTTINSLRDFPIKGSHCFLFIFFSLCKIGLFIRTISALRNPSGDISVGKVRETYKDGITKEVKICTPPGVC